jgi:hypothetical protein
MSQTWRKPQTDFNSLTFRRLSYWPKTSASEAGLLAGTANPPDHKSRWMQLLTKRYLFLAIMALGLLGSASAQSVLNCSSFSTTGACGVGGGQAFNPVGGTAPPSVSGSRILFIPSGTTHQGTALNYTTKVNVQAFTAHFTFVPNGQNVAFVLQNTSNTPGYQGTNFVAGAGCEAGFFQAFGSFPPPNNIFALELDSWSYLGSVQSFTYSSAQIYSAGQSPCNPNDSGPNYTLIDKISTSPVPLNSPASAQGTSTGDTYSATLTYDGTNLTLNMYDVTAGGACPGANCFTHTWSVDIPSWVGADTAYAGITGAPGETSTYPLYIDSFSYANGATTQPTNPTPPATETQVATPKFAPGAGTYSSAQSVTISDATSGASIYYTTNGTTPTTSSAKYTSPVSVSTTETLQAMAVASGDIGSSVASAGYTMSSSSSGSAPVINYPSGFASDPSQLWLGNSSVYSGSSIELTSLTTGLADNVWYKTPVNVQAFTTTFTWTANCPAKPAQCGDGMGFMIISNSNPSSSGYNYAGSQGSQLSWSRCYSSTNCPSIKSILVKFDLYNNSTGSEGANLTGFYSGGVDPQPPQAQSDMSSSGINMESGHLMKATLTYNGTVLMETVTDTVTGATYRNSYSANIPALVGGNTALVGFGGSTGGADVTQKLQSWTYAVESPGN